MRLFITIAICLVIGYFISNIVKSNEVKTQSRQNTTNAVQASNRAASTFAVNKISEHANIDKTLRLVAENWKKTDVNKDGKNNCIDAAVLFYQYYPDKNKVCIEINVNSKTGMNHLFNCVFTDGVWKAVEPQSYANNHSNYLMWAVWGNQYDNKYNRDVTSDYLKYVQVTATTAKKSVEPKEPVDVWAILRRVSDDMNRKVDVTRDGRTNCQDATVLFYQYYPYKEDVRMMSNPPLNHAFIVMKVNGAWIGVEPQAVYSNWNNTYLMKDIWSGRYDSSKNVDKTDYYKQFVKGN